MSLDTEIAFSIMNLSLFVAFACSLVIGYLLKGKVSDKLNELISIISLVPLIPIYWATRLEHITESNRTFTFYFALSISLIVLIMLGRRTYLYNKEGNVPIKAVKNNKVNKTNRNTHANKNKKKKK